MIGRNEMYFCEAEMKKAIEVYLATVVLQEEYAKSADVTSIKAHDHGFKIMLNGKEDEIEK